MALAASLLAVSPDAGLSEPTAGTGRVDARVPPGEPADPLRFPVENPPAPGTTEARIAAYAARAASTGIPRRALQAYLRAEEAMGRAAPDCGLRWSLLAAVGRVESDHGRYEGRSLLPDGTSSSPITGLPLDGRPGLALIRDTDGGRLDGDITHDRAVGPLQFIPSTWAYVATDGDGDGVLDPHDIDDAAMAAGRYLCAYGGLDTPAGLRDAVLRYNPSSEYADLVLRIMALYDRGIGDELPALGGAPSTEPAPSPPLPPANMEPPPTREAPRHSRPATRQDGGEPAPRPEGGGGSDGDGGRDGAAGPSPSGDQADQGPAGDDVQVAPDRDQTPVPDVDQDTVRDRTQRLVDDTTSLSSPVGDLTPTSVG